MTLMTSFSVWSGVDHMGALIHFSQAKNSISQFASQLCLLIQFQMTSFMGLISFFEQIFQISFLVQLKPLILFLILAFCLIYARTNQVLVCTHQCLRPQATLLQSIMQRLQILICFLLSTWKLLISFSSFRKCWIIQKHQIPLKRLIALLVSMVC